LDGFNRCNQRNHFVGQHLSVLRFAGYLTPSLIDEHAAGHPTDAGQAYAINVLGCILGPLFACYVLLPYLSERYALILLGLPFFIFWFFFSNPNANGSVGIGTGHRSCSGLVFVILGDFEGMLFKMRSI